MDYIYEGKVNLLDVTSNTGGKKKVQLAACDLVSECRMGDNNSETPQSSKPTSLQLKI